MAKDIKKKGKTRKLKRSIRKTLGALFLASALVVAAIPTEGLEAASASPAVDNNWGTLKDNWGKNPNLDVTASSIPDCTGKSIYTTGDGNFQFAYEAPAGQSSDNRVAVILGYYKSQTLDGGTLRIPDTVDAYAKLSSNVGNTDGGRCAVSRNNDFIYYLETPVYDPIYDLDEYGQPKKAEDGTLLPPIRQELNVAQSTFKPCTYDTRSNWEKATADAEELWYYPNGVTNGVPNGQPVRAVGNEHTRIRDAAVSYIGNQYLTEGDGGEGTWKVAGNVTYNNRESGVFANARNIVTLIVGQYMVGIGDYAFYGCASVTSIELQNGLNTIGVGAFANCINMTEAKIALNAQVSIIGDYAFYACRSLRQFTVPISVSILGNSVFEGCYNLESIEMAKESGEDSREVMLSELGDRVFKGCEKLQSLSFPRSFAQADVSLSIFDGCSALQYVEASNMNVNFVADGASTFGTFKQTVPAAFYFKGSKDSELHKTATREQIAYSFYDSTVPDDVYELTVVEDGKKAVYRVDTTDRLVYCDMESGMATVTLPATIGPHKLTSIDSRTFQHNCALTKITIPASITAIEANAFQGCHRLKSVIFTDPSNLVTIGSGAFKTQEDIIHTEGQAWSCPEKDSPLIKDPVLYFVGPISYDSTPFTYAMDPNENINNNTQNRTYITYYSGFPTNLEVRYNPDTEKNELVDYPTLNTLTAYATDATGKYPYLTEENKNSITSAASKYRDASAYPGDFTDEERQVMKSVLEIELPEGIESVKSGLFREKEDKEVAPAKGLPKTLTAYSLHEVEDEMFDGCKYLTSVTLSDATEKIGDYAFKDCESLTTVNLPATVNKMGVRPFVGCEKLTGVNFNGSPYFTCDNSIIYELRNNNKDKIVQCLEARSDAMITANETAGITGIYPEAFMYAENVLSIDLSASTVDTIPEYGFAYTPNLAILSLPRVEPYMTVDANAFKNSAIQNLKVPGVSHQLDENAFGDNVYLQPGDEGYSDKTRDDIGGRGTLHHETVLQAPFQLVCEEGSQIERWAQQRGINTTNAEAEVYYKVAFYDWDQKLIDAEGLVDALGRPWSNPQTVKIGESALEPANLPAREGYRFTGWTPITWQVVMKDTDVYWTGERDDPTEKYWRVTFYDEDMSTVIATQDVKNGGEALSPQVPAKQGKTFQGWRRVGSGVFDLKNITEDIDLFAYYLSDGENPDPTGSGNPGGSGSPSGSPGASGSPNPSGSPGSSGSPNPSGSSNPTGPLYVLTVQNGSGSGNYAEGSQPIIIANEPARGQEFSHWTIDPSDTKIASTVLSASVITMPAQNVTVTAHYKASTSTSSGTGSGNTSSSNNRPNNVSESGVTNGGTTVVIDKNGLSNTGVVSATVNGSSDNFTIKITESTAATEAALRALMTEYGNIDNIKYFPMDISLYDSTGTNKITDTTGLSVSITLPLPDSLAAYAGNNMVAGVVNDRLDKLTPRFTTISGVPCITFTAEHFSPYVIYADISNLSAGGADNTPKTGDGIHPKWFLSIGLACVSLVLFMKKDGRRQRRVRTA